MKIKVGDQEVEIDVMSKDEQNGIFRQIGAHLKASADAQAAQKLVIDNLMAELKDKGPNIDTDLDPTPKVVESVKLEELSREGFGEHLLGQVAELLKPIQASIQAGKEVNTRTELAAQVNAANEGHEDFGQWHEEIKAIIQKNPTLSIEDAYQLAKTKDPGKVDKVDTALKDAASEKAAKDDKKTDNVVKVEFGGLLPTSGLSSSGDDDEGGAKDAKEAGLAAWDEVDMSAHLKAVSDDS